MHKAMILVQTLQKLPSFCLGFAFAIAFAFALAFWSMSWGYLDGNTCRDEPTSVRYSVFAQA